MTDFPSVWDMADQWDALETNDREVNRELAALVLKQIIHEPDSHHQSMWARKLDEGMRERLRLPADCGTQMCVAGWAVTLADPGSVPQWQGTSAWSVITGDGRTEYYPVAATKLLGLDKESAQWLFDAGNTQEDVIWGLTQLVETGAIDLDEAHERV